MDSDNSISIRRQFLPFFVFFFEGRERDLQPTKEHKQMRQMRSAATNSGVLGSNHKNRDGNIFITLVHRLRAITIQLSRILAAF